MQTEIEFKQYRRFLLLNTLYKITNGNTTAPENLIQIASSLNIKNGNFEDALDTLEEYEFIKQTGIGSQFYTITSKGKKIVEMTFSYPNQRSEFFPALKDMGI